MGSCLWKPLILKVKGKIGRAVMVFSWENSLEEPDRLPDCGPETWTDVCGA